MDEITREDPSFADMVNPPRWWSRETRNDYIDDTAARLVELLEQSSVPTGQEEARDREWSANQIARDLLTGYAVTLDRNSAVVATRALVVQLMSAAATDAPTPRVHGRTVRQMIRPYPAETMDGSPGLASPQPAMSDSYYSTTQGVNQGAPAIPLVRTETPQVLSDNRGPCDNCGGYHADPRRRKITLWVSCPLKWKKAFEEKNRAWLAKRERDAAVAAARALVESYETERATPRLQTRGESPRQSPIEATSVGASRFSSPAADVLAMRERSASEGVQHQWARYYSTMAGGTRHGIRADGGHRHLRSNPGPPYLSPHTHPTTFGDHHVGIILFGYGH